MNYCHKYIILLLTIIIIVLVHFLVFVLLLWSEFSCIEKWFNMHAHLRYNNNIEHRIMNFKIVTFNLIITVVIDKICLLRFMVLHYYIVYHKLFMVVD